MGDISRHRNIFFNTRGAIPPALLSAAHVSATDLTYLELGNYFTDVSQFRDPVFYIFSKQSIWREFVLPKLAEKKLKDVITLDQLRGLSLAAGTAAGTLLARNHPKLAALAGALGLAPALISNNLIAGLLGIDDWIDRMFGVPFERLGGSRKRTSEEFGYVGQFFEHFVKGITHLLFASEVTNGTGGDWAGIDRIPETSVEDVFRDAFTQYFPHEHTDQPPYVWDASKRSKYPKWYAPSTRQNGLTRTGGIMGVVDGDYMQYISQGLSQLERDWRAITTTDVAGRRKCLLRMGKLLHAVEDWYFHSNIVELIRLHGQTPPRAAPESDEDFTHRFVEKALADQPEFRSATDDGKTELKRRLYRRLRFPEYLRGTGLNSGGVPSPEKSSFSLGHAYPAFPSQQDSTHTLLGALEELEQKVESAITFTPGGGFTTPAWGPCVIERFFGGMVHNRHVIADKARARGTTAGSVTGAILDWRRTGRPPTGAEGAAIIDVLRETLPLLVTLLYESERQRLVENVDPLLWRMPGSPPASPAAKAAGDTGSKEVELQLERHLNALKPVPRAGAAPENNYQRAARHLHECGFINELGRKALHDAFQKDQDSEEMHGLAPGAGGILINFAVKLQRGLERGRQATKQHNARGRIFQDATNNGSFNEIIGSHSLMSKDTDDDSFPFFDDARVLASVASQAVLHLMLEEIGTPGNGTGLHWQKILQFLIRFPVSGDSWERRAVAFFRDKDQVPKFADLPELAQLKTARLTAAQLETLLAGKKAEELEGLYIKLEKDVSDYRYPG